MLTRPTARLTSDVAVVVGWRREFAANADPLADPNHTITIQLENDSTRPGSDNYYTGGGRIAYTSPTGQVPAPIAAFGHMMLGNGQQRGALELSQEYLHAVLQGHIEPAAQ